MVETIFVTPHLGGKGGTETVTRKVLKEYEKRKLDYLLLQVGSSEDNTWSEDLKQKSCHYSSNKLHRNLNYFVFLLRNVIKYKPVRVLCLDPILCYYLNIIRKISGHSFLIVSWIHFSANAPNVRKEYIKYADYHLIIASKMLDQYEKLGIHKNRIRIVFNPIDIKNDVIPRPLKSKKPIFIYIGRILFEGQKRLKDVFDAFSKIHQSYELIIYGDGPDVSVCKEYCSRVGIISKVRFMGYVKDPWNYIDFPVTALILSSAYEGLPMTLIEAIARGVYVISSNCETGPDDIINNDNGTLFEMGNVTDIYNKIFSIIKEPPMLDQYKAIGTIEKFSSKNYFKRFFDAIESFEDATL